MTEPKEPSADDADLREWFWRCALNLQNAAIKSVAQIAHPCDADHFADDAMRRTDALTAAAVQEERERIAEAVRSSARATLDDLADEILKAADRPAPEGAAPMRELLTSEQKKNLDEYLARRRCSTPSQEDTGSVSGERWPCKGGRMIFLGKNGYDYELEDALSHFVVGEQYTVADCEVGSWSHSVRFKEIPGRWNGVMFSLVPPTDARNPGSASNTDTAQEKAPEVSESYRAMVEEMQTNPGILNRPMVDQMTKIEDEPTQTVAAPGPTAGDVERLAQAMLSDLGNAWKLNMADPHRRVVPGQLSSADLMSMAEVAIASARAELLAQIREPLRDAVAWAIHDAPLPPHDNNLAIRGLLATAALRALGDKLAEAK